MGGPAGSSARLSTRLAAESAYAPAGGARRLQVGGRTLLFSEQGQQLFELNETADVIWRRLAAGGPAFQAEAALRDLGLGSAEARDFVQEILRAWLAAGLLVPAEARDALARAPNATRRLDLGEMVVEVRIHGSRPPAAWDAAFGHLHAPTARPSARIEILRRGELFHLFRDGAAPSATGPAGLVPQLKAALTEIYLQAERPGFATHAACLVRNGRALLLSGPPGAGKTTLAVALAAREWAYGGDDIVRIAPDGRVAAAPFAAAVKAGAWGLAAQHAPEIANLPVYVRGDGRQVRYWRPARLAGAEPRPLGAVLLLDRQEAARATLTPVEPVEVLTTLLRSAYAANRRLDGEVLAALGESLSRAGGYRLTYRDLAEAAEAIGGLADV